MRTDYSLIPPTETESLFKASIRKCRNICLLLYPLLMVQVCCLIWMYRTTQWILIESCLALTLLVNPLLFSYSSCSIIIYRTSSIIIGIYLYSRDTKLLIPFILDCFCLLLSLILWDQVRFQEHLFSKECKEEQSSYFSRLTFTWFNTLISIGNQKHLSLEDLDELRQDDRSDAVLHAFNQTTPGSLLGRLFKLTWKLVALQVFWAFLVVIFSYTGPFCLQQILLYVESYPEGNPYYALGYCAAIFICNIIRSFADGQMYFIGRRIGLRVRSVIISLVYQKSLKKTCCDESVGMISNLMSVDATKVLEVSCYMMYVWTTPLQAIICIIFLVYIAGYPGLVGVSVMLVMVPVGAKVGQMIQFYQKKLMSATDSRINSINELLQGIRIVKFFAWEKKFLDKINDLRQAELTGLWHYILTIALSKVLWQTTPVLVSFLTFSCMTYFAGQTLTAATAFTALTLFNALRGPLHIFPDIIVRIGEALVSLKRVTDYLEEPEIDGCHQDIKLLEKQEYDVHIEKGSVFNRAEFSLKCPGISFVPKGLNVIIGPTGSGKSSLLLSILGELSCKVGSVYLSKEDLEHIPIAYAGQQVWLQNCTIRDNITFGSPFDEERYAKTLWCCSLLRDLETLEGKDMTEVGEKGVNLSGGQKARISLARAVYSSSPIILLDDILSAVDAPTAQFLFTNCIQGELLSDRTRILVTHNTVLCEAEADLVIQITQGNMTFREQSPVKKPPTTIPSQKLRYHSVKRITDDESRFKGSVPPRVYGVYLTSAGGVLFVLGLVATYGLTQLLVISNDWWLKVWADAYSKMTFLSFVTPISEFRETISQLAFYPAKPNIDYYLQIYALLGGLTIVFLTLKVLVVSTGSMKASKHIHMSLMQRILNAPIRFFEKTPTGRIINRFSKDMKDIDQEVAFFSGDFLSNLISCVAVVLLILMVSPMTLLGLLPISLAYVFIALRYIRTSRELKRLDSNTRSPIYSHFSETLNGSRVIRAYAAEDRFLKECHGRIDCNHKAFFYLWVSNRWLGIRVDFIGSLVSVTCCLVVLYALHFGTGVNAGSAGLTISYSLSFSDALLWLVRMHALMEMEMNAVERIDEYLQLEQEPEQPSIAPDFWPKNGHIQFQNLSLKYADDIILKNVTFEVKPGHKVGIVGRTGAGKTTLSLALFRFVDFHSGTIYIDGLDISKMNLHVLRSRLTVIPQDPVLFEGTLRSNLDPFQQRTDTELWYALEHSHFLDSRSSSIDLDYPIQEGGTNLSQGQRQLLCLARALLRQSKLIVLDEATASVDHSTDVRIQHTIRNEMRHSTLLCIAHRLRTVIDYDRILVLDKGTVAQYDSPRNLMNTVGIFQNMCRESGEFDELLKLSKP